MLHMTVSENDTSWPILTKPAPIVYARKANRLPRYLLASMVLLTATRRCPVWMISSIDAGLLAATLGGVFWLLARIAFGPVE